MSASKVTRRSFLRTTVAAAGAAAMTAKSYAQVKGANERLNMGVIGCGGMSNQHLGGLLKIQKDENLGILAVCDLYDTRAKKYAERIVKAGGDPKIFHNYHDVLAIKDIDYVLNATPEHAHAYVTLEALDAGKHVYCEKPMTHTIEEGQKVLAKAKQTGLKLQVGVQGMSDDSYSSAYEAIKAGKLGPVVEATVEYSRNYSLDQGPWRSEAKTGDPKPADLDWEAWLGPATKREWDARRYYNWRCYRDYSGGVATDLFVHRLTRVLKACGLGFPKRAIGMGGIYLWDDGRDLPDSIEMLLEYPKIEGVTPGMTVRILGTMANDCTGDTDRCIRGHDATLLFTPEGWVIRDEKKKDKPIIETFKKTGAEDTNLHHKNHHAAIRNGTPLNCPPELGLYAVVAVCMGNQSWFTHKMLAWDADKGAVVPA